MSEISKPDYSTGLWSSGGSIVAPSNVKIQTGWTSEVPPFQWENWSQNRQDSAIVHLFQKGLSVWSSTQDYYFTSSGPRAYVQGSNGQVYVAVANSTGQDPVTDSTNTYWMLAFATASTTYTKAQVDSKTTLASQAQAVAITDNTTLMSPLRTGQALNATGPAPIFAARAWGTFTGIPPTPTGTFGNVASVTKTSTGVYQVTFTTNMSSTNYAVVTSGTETSHGQDTNQDTVQPYNKTVSGFVVECFSAETSRADFFQVSFVVFGN